MIKEIINCSLFQCLFAELAPYVKVGSICEEIHYLTLEDFTRMSCRRIEWQTRMLESTLAYHNMSGDTVGCYSTIITFQPLSPPFFPHICYPLFHQFKTGKPQTQFQRINPSW